MASTQLSEGALVVAPEPDDPTLDRARAHVRILSQASIALATADDPHDVLGPLLQDAGAALGLDLAYSVDLLPDRNGAKIVFGFGFSEQIKAEPRSVSPTQSLFGIVAQTGKKLILANIQSSTDPRTALARRAGMRAYAGFPIAVHGEIVNVTGFGSTLLASFDDETIALFEAIVRFIEIVRERRAREQDVREGELRYRTLFDSIDEGFCIIEFVDGPHGPLSDYIHVEANPAYTTNAGIPNVVGQKVRDMVPDEADGWVALYGEVLRTGEPIRFERELVATGRHLELSAFRVEPASKKQVAVLFKDVTVRKRAELELMRLNETLEARVTEAVAERLQEQERLREAEAALRQSQKMEAVGQLTGGLAHDFNNLLSGIAGSFEMIGVRLSQGRSADVDKYLSAGQRATRRAAALTHRLLAFSRRQTLQPKSININRLLVDFVELVRRSVGPAIEVETIAAGGLWLTMVDPNQLDNALLNLCINARDAMPNGGRISIATGNRSLDERAAKALGLDPGQYVTVTVSDTGAGIDKSIIDRVFDPFFTTKPMGEGTGLGLSMVYGFARQSHGHVQIDSEVRRGTRVCLYLPRYAGAEATDDVERGSTANKTLAGETVLIVDDEPTIRMLICDSLSDLGYACKEAVDGPSGLRVLESADRIDLLITDIGLPGGLNGRQLADAARTARSDLKVLFITGYVENAAFPHGHVERGMEVMVKPFAVEELAARVERMLKE